MVGPRSTGCGTWVAHAPLSPESANPNRGCVHARRYAKQGIAYLKDDTCGGPNVPYTIMRDALNKSGSPVFFSLCEPGQVGVAVHGLVCPWPSGRDP